MGYVEGKTFVLGFTLPAVMILTLKHSIPLPHNCHLTVIHSSLLADLRQFGPVNLKALIVVNKRKPQKISLILCLHWAACANACETNRGWRPLCFTVAQIYLFLMQESGLIFAHKSPLFTTQIGMSTTPFNL